MQLQLTLCLFIVEKVGAQLTLCLFIVKKALYLFKVEKVLSLDYKSIYSRDFK